MPRIGRAALVVAIAAAAVCGGPDTASARTFHVATWGDDAQGHGSDALPFRSIQRAVDAAAAADDGADEVRVAAGRHTDRVVVPSSAALDELAISGGWDVGFGARSAGATVVAPADTGAGADVDLRDDGATIEGLTVVSSAPSAGIVIDGPGAFGAFGASDVGAPQAVTITDTHVSGASGDGLRVAGVDGTITIADSTFNGSAGDGIDLRGVGDVVLSGVTGSGNDPGVLVSGAASFSDTDGTYSGNDDHGVQLVDIAGDVTLTRTTANNNDNNNNTVGDGLNVTDGGDAGTVAIGGNLVVRGATFRDTGGASDHQERGMAIGEVAGATTFESATGPARAMLVDGNEADGVDMSNGGTTMTLTGGSYTDNGVNGFHDGLDLNGFGGAVTLAAAQITGNVGDGIELASSPAGLTVTASTFSSNQQHGIDMLGSAAVSLTNVTANDNAFDGVSAFINAPSTIDGGTFSGNNSEGVNVFGSSGSLTLTGTGRATANNGHGVTVVSVPGAVSVDGWVLSDNDDDGNGTGHGLQATSVGPVSLTGVTASRNQTGVGVSNAPSVTDDGSTAAANADHGIQLVDVSGDVTLTRTTADDNDGDNDALGDGLIAADGGDVGTVALDGSLVVRGGRFRDSGAAAHQERGVFVASITGAITFEDASGPARSMAVAGNEADGVVVDDGGTAGTFTGGQYTQNGTGGFHDGVDLAGFGGAVTFERSAIDDNAGDGVEISGSPTLAATDSGFSRNGQNGVDILSPTSVALTRVTAGDNALDGLSGSLTGASTVTEGSFSDNGGEGINAFTTSASLTMTKAVLSGNGDHGLRASGVTGVVGGAAADGNTIDGNAGDGIFVASGSGLAIRGNAISGNAGLGIDLAPDGVSVNDPGDADVGANDGQNFPVLTEAIRAAGGTRVSGTLSGAAGSAYDLHFYASASCDTSEHGEGARLLGSRTVTTDGSGDVAFTASLPGTTAPGEVVTATATNAAGSTSELSKCTPEAAEVPADLRVALAAAPSPAAPGDVVTYTADVTNGGPGAATDVRLVDELPAQADLVDASPTCTGARTVTCELASLAAGATARVTIRVRPRASGRMVNEVTVDALQADPNAANDRASATVTVESPAAAVSPPGGTSSPASGPPPPARVTTPPRRSLRVSVRGLPRRCTRRDVRARITIVSASAVARIRATLDGRRLPARARKRLTLRLRVGRLRAGRHTLFLDVTNRAGQRKRQRFRFRVCARRVTRPLSQSR